MGHCAGQKWGRRERGVARFGLQSGRPMGGCMGCYSSGGGPSNTSES